MAPPPQLVIQIRSLKPGSRWTIILGIGLVAVIIVAFLPPIPQPISYHNFADQRGIFGIPNAADALSNLPFVIAGLAGLFFTLRPTSDFNVAERWTYICLFTGLFLTGIGSAYYHLAPCA